MVEIDAFCALSVTEAAGFLAMMLLQGHIISVAISKAVIVFMLEPPLWFS